MENRAVPRAGEFYMHFKGKLYQIVTVAIHTETEEPLVIYQAMYGTFKTYARPLDMFLSEVDHGKYPDVKQQYRFQKVELRENENAGDNAGIKIFAVDEDSIKEDANAQISNVQMQTGESAQSMMQSEQEQKAADETANETQETAETADIEPLLKFLDEPDLNERLNILVQYRDQITETMLESMGMAIDCVLNGKTLEEKYYELDKVIRTKLQYEKKPRI